MLSSLRKQGPITTGGWASRKVSLQPAIRKDTEYGSPRLCATAHKAGTTNGYRLRSAPQTAPLATSASISLFE
jgi:hypothetical protein